ncbi:hypothetical protein ACFQ7N_39655 [Streptomyces niveus]|uniref:hypothetical protein n=1 Tax=Streptomyces niveus TaxID=193462 RepID=UPI0036737B8A
MLITCLPGVRELTETVTDEFLAGLPRPLLWLQMSPLTEEDTNFLERRASTAGVNYVHAPYFTDPGTQDRPACLVYQDRSVRDIITSGPCAATLIEALSYRSQWVGPLGSDIEHSPDRDALAEHALLLHGQPAL